MSENDLKCSFCGKNQHEVQKIISGSFANICEECITLCLTLLLEGGIDIVISCKRKERKYEETVISFDVKKDD